MDDATDPTRRLLLAALAGGLARAAPADARGTTRKTGKRPKPPLAVAIARVVSVAADPGSLGEPFIAVEVEVAIYDLRPDPPLALGLRSIRFKATAGPAERMRREILDDIEETVAFAAGNLAADRVQVLLV